MESSTIIFLGKSYEGTSASWISFPFLLADIVWIIALAKRLKWGWKLFIVRNLILIPLGLSSVLKIISLSGRMFTFLTVLYIAFTVLIVVTCFYVYQKRNYFDR